MDICYSPAAKVVYPEGFQSVIHVKKLGDHLCGASRPGHFDGVSTVVAKLFHQVQAHRAYFGEKDYQQLCIIQQMVRDLDMQVEVIGVPTVREADGLALSSRNQYLSRKERAVAVSLFQSLQEAAQHIAANEPVVAVLEKAKTTLREKGFAKVDYVALCRAQTVELIDAYEPGCRLLAAAWLGQTRLIDNIKVTA